MKPKEAKFNGKTGGKHSPVLSDTKNGKFMAEDQSDSETLTMAFNHRK